MIGYIAYAIPKGGRGLRVGKEPEFCLLNKPRLCFGFRILNFTIFESFGEKVANYIGLCFFLGGGGGGGGGVVGGSGLGVGRVAGCGVGGGLFQN